MNPLKLWGMESEENNTWSLPIDLEIWRKVNNVLSIDWEQLERWRKELLWSRDKLKKYIWICYLDSVWAWSWIWYFWDTKNFEKMKPKLKSWKSLLSFPCIDFNKNNGIWNNDWFILTLVDLKNMFIALGFRIASEKEEFQRWREQILSCKKELEAVGIIYKDWVWNFSKAKWYTKWPKINWKSLLVFMTVHFNKKNNIWNEKWGIYSVIELRKMFSVIWFKVDYGEIKKDTIGERLSKEEEWEQSRWIMKILEEEARKQIEIVDALSKWLLRREVWETETDRIRKEIYSNMMDAVQCRRCEKKAIRNDIQSGLEEEDRIFLEESDINDWEVDMFDFSEPWVLYDDDDLYYL